MTDEKKDSKEFDFSKDPISNLINSILRTMEDVQWNISHNTREEGGSITRALALLTSAENRVLIPETEKQLLKDRDDLNRNAQYPFIPSKDAQPMINRFSQFLAGGIFADKYGFRPQNPHPKHIEDPRKPEANPNPAHIG